MSEFDKAGHLSGEDGEDDTRLDVNELSDLVPYVPRIFEAFPKLRALSFSFLTYPYFSNPPEEVWAKAETEMRALFARFPRGRIVELSAIPCAESSRIDPNPPYGFEIETYTPARVFFTDRFLDLLGESGAFTALTKLELAEPATPEQLARARGLDRLR